MTQSSLLHSNSCCCLLFFRDMLFPRASGGSCRGLEVAWCDRQRLAAGSAAWQPRSRPVCWVSQQMEPWVSLRRCRAKAKALPSVCRGAEQQYPLQLWRKDWPLGYREGIAVPMEKCMRGIMAWPTHTNNAGWILCKYPEKIYNLRSPLRLWDILRMEEHMRKPSGCVCCTIMPYFSVLLGKGGICKAHSVPVLPCLLCAMGWLCPLNISKVLTVIDENSVSKKLRYLVCSVML